MEKVYEIPEDCDEIIDLKYDSEKNSLTFVEEEYSGTHLECGWFEYNQISNLKSKHSDVNMNINLLKVMENVLFCDPEKGECILYGVKRKLFRKRYMMLTYCNKLKGVEHHKKLEEPFKYKRFRNYNNLTSSKLGDDGILVPLENGVFICWIKNDMILHEECFNTRSKLFDYEIYDNGRTIIATGDEGTVIANVQG